MRRKFAHVVLSAALSVTGWGWHHVPNLHRSNIVLFVDCEDSDKTPCVTWDENQWREVTSYSPYSYKALKVCHGKDHKCLDPHKRHNLFTYYK